MNTDERIMRCKIEGGEARGHPKNYNFLVGMSATAVAERLKISQPAVIISVWRGKVIPKEKGTNSLEK